MHRIFSYLFALTLTQTPTLALAFDVPPNDGFVTDAAGLLQPEEEERLEGMLRAYQRETSNEIAVAIIPTLQGEPIADAAIAIGRAWGVGSEDKDNGVLLLVAYEDRDVFLATGYGLEGAVPDIVAKGIIEVDIAPRFREGAYGEGIIAGVEALRKHIAGEYTAERYASTDRVGGFFPWFLFLMFIIFDLFASVFARTTSWWLGGIVGAVLGALYTLVVGWWLSIPILVVLGLLFDYLVSKGVIGRGGGWGGGRIGGSGGGRGGFGGFGGGSFGGGGAIGKW